MSIRVIDTEPVYLKSNVVIEPLIDKWYAWAHLISPATAAMNIVYRHLEVLDSFIMAPHIHAEAVKNPQMRGGPFMDIPEEKLESVKKLKEETVVSRKRMIELAGAIRKLDKLLREKAAGASLEPLYEQVPDMLRGYVELYYDLRNRPSFRFFEYLLFKSEFYDTSSQGFCLWVTDNDSRPFCLSTPRIGEDDRLYIDSPFANPAIDALSKMKRVPGKYGEIKAMLNITAEQEDLFAALFTTDVPPAYKKYENDKIRMRYFGHACILVETKDVSFLVDPLISYYGYEHEVDRYSDFDLPDMIDYVLITHNHQDHILLETLIPLRHRIKHIIVPSSTSGSLQDPNLKLMFNNVGFHNVIEIDMMETIKFEDCSITGVPFVGEHCDIGIEAKTCYHIRSGEFSVMFMADSCNMESRLYEHVHKELGNVDVMFLGMECDGAPLSWLYGPLLLEPLSRDKDMTRRLAGSNFKKGKQLVDVFCPKELYVYAMGQEPWVEFITSVKYTPDSNPIIESNKMIAYCESIGMTAERLFGEKELLRDVHVITDGDNITTIECGPERP